MSLKSLKKKCKFSCKKRKSVNKEGYTEFKFSYFNKKKKEKCISNI